MNKNLENEIYVQYGCGWCAPERWRNFDASPTLRFERIPLIGKLYTKNKDRFPDNAEYGNVARGLPVNVEECTGVYCSHVLEHLSLAEFRLALHETFRILKSGGKFRLVLPDLAYEVSLYIQDTSPSSAISFMKATSLGKLTRLRGLKGLILEYLGNSQHLTMWDYKGIAQELSNAGFSEIRRAYYGDSEDKRFMEVENIARWENALGVECCKRV